MEIIFSRHAKRRARLYDIPETTIRKILEEKKLPTGTYEIIEKTEEFKYPIKIVINFENDLLTVITSYPLKKGRKR